MCCWEAGCVVRNQVVLSGRWIVLLCSCFHVMSAQIQRQCGCGGRHMVFGRGVCVCVCVCVCECVRERERERDRQTDREREHWHDSGLSSIWNKQIILNCAHYRLQHLINNLADLSWHS